MDASKKIGRLPAQVVDEALIISEMFNLNEMMALQLLLNGEERLCDYPGLTRGLVAILLYYDGRKTLVETLKTLILGRQGCTWTLEATTDVSVFVTKFTQELVNEGLVQNILDLLSGLNWINEMATLQKNMALGDPKHRYQVKELFKGIVRGLADCVFALAAQTGLRKIDTIKLMDHLARIRLEQGNSDGSLDEVTMALLLALLYALDVTRATKGNVDMNGSVINDDYGQILPILSDSTFISAIHREISSSGSKKWYHDGMYSLIRFSWSMTLAFMRSHSTIELGFNVEQHQGVIDEDEAVFEASLDMAVFHWMSKCILVNQTVLKQEEFYVRRLHQLLTDLIVLMPLKVKDLRNRADDAARNKMMHEHEGIQYAVPLSGQHFEYFLHCINQLYLSTNEATSNLILDYWCPIDGGSGNIERYPSRQISLYKFVRLAGDLLVPALYTPYVEMITSIANHPDAALHCFNLLKMNGMGSGGLGVNGGANTISWDHFFTSLQQYFNNLRQDTFDQHHPYQDTIYRTTPARQMTKGISPSEIQGLAAVLRLIGTVCKNSDAARAAIVQNSEWQPLLVMIGLLGCAVPTVLKAELLKTLAAMSKTADVALQVWNGIEASSFISKDTDNSNLTTWTKCGFLMELESIESKNEEYPMTIALLQLVDVLTNNSYVMDSEENSVQTANPPVQTTPTSSLSKIYSLVVDEIFLRINSRAYKNPSEKWLITKLSLKIMNKLLQDFEPSKANLNLDFKTTTSAGFQLVSCLLQPSELLRILLLTLNEACSTIEKFIDDIAGKNDIEEASLNILNILRRALILQPAVLKASRDAQTCNVIFAGLDKLLFGINPRTGKADHITTIAKFVTFSWWLPHHALNAIKLIDVLSTPSNQSNMLGSFLITEALGKSIIKGFTDVIEGDYGPELDENDHTSPYDTIEATVGKGTGRFQSDTAIEVEKEARIAAIQLLQKCVFYPGPSIAHFLLGFDLNNVSGSTLRTPVGTVRTPLHAMLGLLQSNDGYGNDSSNEQPFLTRCPKAAEAIAKLIYNLVSNYETTGPILRYLHSSDDFFIGQLGLLPVKGLSLNKKNNLLNYSIESLKAQAWLLKSAAIEVKGMCHTKLRSQLLQWIGLLLSPRSVVSSGEQGLTIEDMALMQSGVDAELNQLSHFATTGGLVTMTNQANTKQSQNRLLSILNSSIDFSEGYVTPPTWEIFDTEQVKIQLNKCRNVVVEGCNQRSSVHLINIKHLNEILRQELASVSVNLGHSQKSVLIDEVNSILRYAVQLNFLEEEAETKKNLFDGWRQVCEVILCCTPSDVLSNSSRQQILLEVLQTLLNKVSNPDGISLDLSSQVSGVVLLLLTTLRRTYEGTKYFKNDESVQDSFFGLPLLDHPDKGPTRSVIYPSGLQVILKGLILWITSTNSGSQRVRVNLYGALLNYLRIGKEGKETMGINSTLSDIERLDIAKLKKANIDVLSGFGDMLIDTICRDSVSGHDIRRILALGLLDQLISLDKKGTWMWYVSREGYLKHIIEMLSSEDNELLNMLSPQQTQPKILFTYESKMAFFTRIASTLSGAELLLESGLMVRLAEMKVFSARPESAFPPLSQEDTENNHNTEYMSTMDIFHQIFFPALRLCQALLACLGPQNLSAAGHIRHFVKANESIFQAILHPPTHESLTMSGLEELSLVTGILAKCETSNDRDNSNGNIHARGLFQLRQQMITLIHHFDLSEHMLRKVTKLVGGLSNYKRKQDALSYLIKISCNLHMYARQVSTRSQLNVDNTPTSAGKYVKDCTVIFSPSFLDANSTNSYQQLSGRPVSIGQVLRSVEHLVIQFIKLHSSLSEEENNVPNQNQVGNPACISSMREDMESNQTHVPFNANMLFHLVRLTGASIESTIWISWRHLEHFLSYGNALEMSNGFSGMYN